MNHPILEKFPRRGGVYALKKCGKMSETKKLKCRKTEEQKKRTFIIHENNQFKIHCNTLSISWFVSDGERG